MDTKENKILYLDCYSGISGDMFLGALLDAGLSLKELQDGLSLLPLNGYRLETKKVIRGGVAGTSFKVITCENKTSFRNLTHILDLYKRSSLPISVIEKCRKIFKGLAEAEASIHGVSIDKVHFHEVGALDAIIDITGVALGLHILKINEVICSPLPLGRGMVKCEHGLLPLPAPATVALLADCGAPVYDAKIDEETVTPTGAAILSVVARKFSSIPEFIIQKIGYGAGCKEFPTPNFLRLFIGEKHKTEKFSYTECADLIEANIDDMTPELLGYVLNLLMEKGASDVYFTNIQMKKNRPAIKLSVLSPPDKTSMLTDTIFRETSTIGCRICPTRKIVQARDTEIVQTPWGEVRVKVIRDEAKSNEIIHFSPEYEDCLAIARRENVPLKNIFRAAECSFYHIYHK